MSVFGIYVFLVAIALAFILPPLFRPAPTGRTTGVTELNIAIYRTASNELDAVRHRGEISREEYESDRQELEFRLIEDVSLDDHPASKMKQLAPSWKLGYTLAVMLPLLAILLYMKLGDPSAVHATHDSPNDPQGWVILARSYAALERYKEATDAFERAAAAINNDPDLLTEYAYAVSRTTGHMKGKAADLVYRALQLNPDNPKALVLAGNAAFEAGTIVYPSCIGKNCYARFRLIQRWWSL
jgi:cytochrome c-type biogenesis protein CcmH